MTTPHTTERPCPACGYDLRASPPGPCPECGTPVHAFITSRIPWTHRKRRGTLRAYFQTLHFTLRHPILLARETSHWISRKHARRFHHLSLLLATIISTALLAITFLLRGEKWIDALQAHVPLKEIHNPNRQAGEWPIYALTDTLWILLPIALSMYCSWSAAMWLYRALARAFSGNRRHRIRLNRILHYSSAHAITQSLLWGLVVIGTMLLYEDRTWMTPTLYTTIQSTTITLGILAALLFYIPTFTLIAKTGRWKILRCLFLFPIYYWLALSAGIGVWIIVFWTTGYIAVMLWSMTR